MEDVVERPGHYFSQALAFMGRDGLVLPEDEDFTFDEFTGGRKVGQSDEASHYRSGDPDDWRHHLPPAVIAYILVHFRPILERFYPEAL